ncbi:hypothetical protein AU476_18240 [Cupriavidus sp. UYMSc13B]|nr:hypothetical protein AU476_18240 [Cupriavidus sp. UYMSc13B]
MRTDDRGSALAQSDLKSLDRMLTAAPAQLLSRLPRPPFSALDFSEKLYQAGLPQWIDCVDQQMSPCERALERVQHHFIATEIEAETLFAIYTMARVMTASMERHYIGWCHKLAELSMGTTEVKHASSMRMSLVICAPLYMSAHKGLEALSKFIGCPIPHRTWTDFDAQGNVTEVRRAVYWQLVLLLVPMPEGIEEIDILEAIVDAYDLTGCFDTKAELVYQEGMTAEAALEGSVDTIYRRYQSVLGPFKHLLQYRALSPEAVATYCDLLPLALMSNGRKS